MAKGKAKAATVIDADDFKRDTLGLLTGLADVLDAAPPGPAEFDERARAWAARARDYAAKLDV